MAKILVTGGAGYIGSFMVRGLLEKGYEVVVLDSLERGNPYVIPENVSFYKGKVGDRELLEKIAQENPFEAVIHFAGYISMKESMENPSLYFEQNTYQTLQFLENLKNLDKKYIIFSSTAGVYGNPERVPINEDDRKDPTNPYGESKLMVERILYWYNKIYGVNYAVLRYFNACGASLDGSFGEKHTPETHIIPVALQALKEEKEFILYGTDYNTPDGTCVRDYVHVLDLVNAHMLALEKILNNPGGYTYNVGTGKGYSNREIVGMIEEVTGRKLNYGERERRPGDADELVADVTRIKDDLGFEPQYSDLKTIIETAWKWHNKV